MFRAHLISHTHWDREWYCTRMEFRPRLVRLVDGLLDLAENSPEYVSFMFDAQTIAINDYLEVKPYNKPRLEKAIQNGKIIIGPWYILPDELLISGESHIRNYLVGDAIAAEYGKKMEIGYLPDSFGHPEQMPQILQGLGLDTTIFWRGASNEMDKTEFYWTAPDGESQVLCVNMPLGYSTAARLGGDIGRAVGQLEQAMDLLGEVASTEVLLLMNGSDHLLADKHVPEIVENFNQKSQDKQVIFSTLPAFLRDLKANLPDDTKNFSGNLCYSDKTILLGGTLSTRMYLKQENHKVQKKLERYLEPLHAHERLAGGSFDFAGYQQYLWKLVLENHPHDSICGCSVDPLHDEMMTRFASLTQLEDTMLADTVDRLAKPAEASAADAECLLFEPSQDKLPQYAEVEICFNSILKHSMNYPIATTAELPGELPPAPEAVRVEDENGNPIPAVLLRTWPDTYDMRLADYDQPSIWHSNRATVALLVPGLEYGLHTLRFYKEETAATPPPAPQAERVENEFYTISFNRETADFTIIDKKTGKTHAGANSFVDMGDAGDEYTYSWPDEDKTFTLNARDVQGVEVTTAGFAASLTVRGVLRLPAALTDDRKARRAKLVACPFTVTATVTKGLDRIDFATTVENLAKDHRLQVEFPVGALCTHSAGSAAFAVTQNPIERPVPEVWEEYPKTTSLNHGFIDVGDGAYGISMAAEGITEYDAVNREGQSYLRLTLLRCVGWLSLPGLNTRRINGGWQCETPGGQCLGEYTFHYAISYHNGSWQQAGTYPLVDRALHPAYIKQSFAPLGKQANPLAFLSDTPPLVRISAVLPAGNNAGVVVRVYSLAEKEETVTWRLPESVKEAHLVSLTEKPLKKLAMDENRCITFPVGKSKIVSVALLP